MRRWVINIVAAIVIVAAAGIFAMNRARGDVRPFQPEMKEAIYLVDVSRVTVADGVSFTLAPDSVDAATLDALPAGWFPEKIDPAAFPGVGTCQDVRHGVPRGYTGFYGVVLTYPPGTDFDQVNFDMRDQFTFMGGSLESMDFTLDYVTLQTSTTLFRFDIDRTKNTVTFNARVSCRPAT